MNDIVNAMNAAFEETVFCVMYSEVDNIQCDIYPPRRFTEISFGLYYVPEGRVIMSTSANVSTADLDKRKEEVGKSFNNMIVAQMLFSLPTEDKLVNSRGETIISMADITKKFVDKKNKK